MAIENGIIQHRFVHNRSTSNNICYICGEEQVIHLNELNISINVNENSLEESKKEQKKNIETNSNVIQSNSIINTNIYNLDNYSKKSLSFSTIKNSECDINKNNINNNILSSESLNLGFNRGKEIPKMPKAINIKEDLKSKQKKIECEVCNEMFIVNNNNKVEKCGHAFCSNCWYDFLSVKIKESKLTSIKCLDYNCKEKLKDEFIINLLKSDIDLIRKFKRYKLELEIINDPNKKLCPYPNCDSYLELKQIRNKDVTCKNNHTFCFECLKKPHGKLPCNENLDKSMEEYAINNFVKKCPKCSIITEKNNGCNHITCTKCGYQWCWLCNQEYNVNHFVGGKCKGFQNFQPKNEYEIKLMMEGKINFDELSISQRQFVFIDNDIPHFGEPNEEEIYISFKFSQKVIRVFFFLFFGNFYFIFKQFDLSQRLNNYFYRILIIMIFFVISLSFFFQMIFLNILSLLLILIFFEFKKFILTIGNSKDLYSKKLILIIINILFGTFFICYYLWKKLINETYISNKFGIKYLIFFPCAIMSIIIYYPQRLLINIVYIIFIYIRDRKFSELLSDLDNNFNNVFNFRINQDSLITI